MPGKKRKRAESAIKMLRVDHQKVKALFDQYEQADDSIPKHQIVRDALMELKIHAAVEEEFFYPALRQEVDDKEGLMDEADEEHHVAKVLIAELEVMKGDEHNWEAKFRVLAESVRRHIKEEEGEMFPKARKTDIDFAALGAGMAELKMQLTRDGIPPDAEALMIAKFGLQGDSRARKAQQGFRPPKKAA